MPTEGDWRGSPHLSAAGSGLAQGYAVARRLNHDIRQLNLIISSILHKANNKMPVPYGFGVGDFVAVGTLAWSVYKSCKFQPHSGCQPSKMCAGKAAPASFDNISMEVISLHAVLKECEETVFDRPLQPTRAERLSVIKDGCDKVLVDLQSLVDKYESLGTQSKRTWDRMKWGNEDIADIRARLISSTTMLNTFISTSQSNVESKLDKFIEEYRQGRREASVVSLQTVDSLSTDDKAVWRTIRKELEEIGISVAAFDTNRKFIYDWFIRAVETGAFEEQGERVIDDENDYGDQQPSSSNNERVNQDVGHPIRHTQSASFTRIRKERPSAQPQLLVAANVAGSHSPEPDSKQTGEIVASPRVLTRDGTQVPRISAILAVISPPRRRLLRAVEREDFSKAIKILTDEVAFQLLDPETLGKALLSTTLFDGLGSSDHLSLISTLIARGANVNYINSNPFARTPLQNSVDKKSIAAVRLLLLNGADVNYYGSKVEPADAQIYQPDWFAPRLALTENTEMLRILLSAGADINAFYKIPRTDYVGEIDFVRVTLLHEAARLGAIPAIEVLIAHGAEIDSFSPSYGTALMVAIFNVNENVAKLLLARGANARFDAGYKCRLQEWQHMGATPIAATIAGGKLSMVKLLLKCGARIDQSTLDHAKHKMDYWPRSSGRWRVDVGRREDNEIIDVLGEALMHREN